MIAANIPLRQELKHDSILHLPVDDVWPSPENSQLYRRIDPDDPEIAALADSIAEHGVQTPLVVTEDGWIISGHRRHAAARLADLELVPCRVEPFVKDDDPDRFLRLLRECNRQRVKTFDEKLREEIVSINPDDAYTALTEYRQQKAAVQVETIPLRKRTRRAAISSAKQPLLDAVQQVLDDRRDFWPLSDRQIHYALLNDPPLKHASKPDSGYANDQESYHALINLLTRARLERKIPFEAIGDETRPVVTWRVHPDVQVYLRNAMGSFLQNYWRDLQQSQPNHIEIVGEKNTIGSIIRPVAAEYCIPMTLGRGYCSIPPRHDMAVRFEKSGKDRLILLIVSDFDPDGEEIAHSFARSMRDDFGIENITPVKVALTAEQVEQFALCPGTIAKKKKKAVAKKTSVHYEKFVKKHGKYVFELEALPPTVLQQILREAIDSVLDIEAFNHEVTREHDDAAELAATRQTVNRILAELGEGNE